ncbi:MAG: hypothetical protein AAGA56_08390 [Myxococcota bacterium]
MSEEKTYEMQWDCEYCGAEKLLGKTHRHCPECGAPQNPEKRYFPPDDQKVAVEDHAYVGADVHCSACGHAQSAAVKFCANCGSPMDGGREAHRQAEVVVGGEPPPKPGGRARYVLAALAILVVVGIGVTLFWKREASAAVTGHRWERTIEVERFGAVEKTRPCEDVPEGAEILSRKKPEPKCKTRKIDQGDGTFKEKKECEKVVETCRYRAEEWSVARTLKAVGGRDDALRWPAVKLGQTGTCEGCEREGQRRSAYVVELKDSDGEAQTCRFDDETKWKRFEVGDQFKARKSVVTGSLDCASLSPAP